jgi:hypothetical protein
MEDGPPSKCEGRVRCHGGVSIHYFNTESHSIIFGYYLGTRSVRFQSIWSAFVCLFVCFESHEQFFSYLATVIIAGDRAANLNLCLALTAFSSEGSFTCHAYCDTGPPFLRSYPKDPWFYPLNAVLLAKKQSLPILNVLGLTRLARAGLELTTYRLLSESTTTRLRQPVTNVNLYFSAKSIVIVYLKTDKLRLAIVNYSLQLLNIVLQLKTIVH